MSRTKICKLAEEMVELCKKSRSASPAVIQQVTKAMDAIKLETSQSSRSSWISETGPIPVQSSSRSKSSKSSTKSPSSKSSAKPASSKSSKSLPRTSAACPTVTCPAGKHITAKCRCQKNPEKGPCTKVCPPDKRLTKACRCIQKSSLSSSRSPPRRVSTLSAERLQRERNEKIKQEKEALDRQVQARLAQARRILQRPINSPRDITDADSDQIEQFLEQERQRARRQNMLARDFFGRAAREGVSTVAPVPARAPALAFQNGALAQALNGLGLNL